jgi:hypothetical protein
VSTQKKAPNIKKKKKRKSKREEDSFVKHMLECITNTSIRFIDTIYRKKDSEEEFRQRELCESKEKMPMKVAPQTKISIFIYISVLRS